MTGLIRLAARVMIVLVLALTVVASGGPLAPLARAAEEQVLRIRLLGDITTLDPPLIYAPHENYLAWNVYNALVRYKPGTSELEPDLAKSWDVSKDGKLLTFHLRKDVVWHKGFGKFTAADVKYTFSRVIDPATRSRYRGLFTNIDKIETPDDYTVKISLKSPDPTFLTNGLPFRPGWIVNRNAVEKYGKEYGVNPVGTGPFMFESWTPGTRGVLVANDQYFEGAPKLRRVEFIPILKEEVVELALKRGEIDVAPIRSPEVYDRLKKDPSIKMSEGLMSGVWTLWLDTKQGVFANRDARRAVAHGLDREGIANVLLRGLAQPAHNIINPVFRGYTDAIPTYPYDVKKARELVKAAGVEGKRVRLLVSTLVPWPQVMPILQRSLEQIGFKVDSMLTEYGAWYAEVGKRNYDIAAMGIVRPPDPLGTFAEAFASKNSGFTGNFSYYDRVDGLIDAAFNAETDARRLELYKNIQRQIADDSPVVPVFYMKVVFASRSVVKNPPLGILNEVYVYRVYKE